MLSLTAARPADCDALARTSRAAFDADVLVGAPGPGGPPGYDSAEWCRRALAWGRVFVIAEDGRTVGGAILIAHSADWMELGRVWLEPSVQGRGLGRAVLADLEQRAPAVRRWTLDTPAWNLRNRHFYTRCGYAEVGIDGDSVRFEKRVEAETPG